MVAYSILALNTVLNDIPAITGRPTFKALWDLMRQLLPLLRTIQHPDHPEEGMAGIMMETAAYAIVSARPWVVPDRVGEVFTIPSWCMRETDMRTEEGKWTAKKDREINFDNLITCLRQMFHRVIDPTYHTGGTTMGRGGFGLRSPIEILRYLQARYGTPTPQEEQDATERFATPMNPDDPPEVMMLALEELQQFWLAHPEGGRGYTDVQLIRQATANLWAHGHLYSKALSKWNREDAAHRMVWTNFKTCMYEQYERMLQAQGGGTLATDGYGGAFNAIQNEETEILTASVVNYAEQSGRVSAEVAELNSRLEAMELNLQPRTDNYANNAMYQPPMGPPTGYGAQQEYGFYMPQQQTTVRGPHPGPFGSNQEWQQWSREGQPSGQPTRESTKRRRITAGNERPGGQQGGQSTSSRPRGGGGGGGGRTYGGGRMNVADALFTREGRGGRPGGTTHTNTLKTFDNLKYCPNYRCGYDVDHDGWECPHHPPWNVRRNEAHLVEGASMKAQHKTLADGTGAGVAWLMANPISQAQWVIEQRREFGRLQRGNGGGRGGGRGGPGRGRGGNDRRNANNGGRGYARGGGGSQGF